MIDQLLIDEELHELENLARLNELKNTRFFVERGDAGVAIVLAEVDGLPAIWNEFGKDTVHYSSDNGEIKINLNLTIVLPQYVTLIFPDGTIKRGRDMTHEQQDKQRQALAEFYLRNQENAIIKMLRKRFPAEPLEPERDDLQFAGLDMLIRGGYRDES